MRVDESYIPHNLRPLFKGMTAQDVADFRNSLRKSCAGEDGVYVPTGRRLASGDQEFALRKDVTGNAGVTTALGLLPTPLESPAKMLVPFPTPLRNSIPRDVVGGSSVLWKKLVSPPANIWGFVAEATPLVSGRNSPVTLNETDVTLNFKTIEMETFMTPEALYGSKSSIVPGQDFQAAEVNDIMGLMNTFLAEEWAILGANVTALGAPATPTANATQPAASAGSLTPGGTYSVKVSALVEKGYVLGANGRAGGVDSPGETTPSSILTVTIAGSGAGSTALAFSWTATRGAVAYNIYAHNDTSIVYVTTVYTNTYTLTALGTSTNTPNSADQTGSTIDYNGLLPQAIAATGGYWSSLDGAVLTGDNRAGITQYETVLKYLYDHYRIGPDVIYESSAQKAEADAIILGSSAPVYRIDLQAGDSEIKGGMSAGPILNRYMPSKPWVERKVHPFLPPGTVLFMTQTLGEAYPNSNVGANIQMKLGWDYRKFPFGITKRAWEAGIDVRGALGVYASFGLACLSNVG